MGCGDSMGREASVLSCIYSHIQVILAEKKMQKNYVQLFFISVFFILLATK